MLDARILGQLLLIQSMVPNLPEEAIPAFVQRGLADLPGISTVRLTLSAEADALADHDAVAFPVAIRDIRHGVLRLTVGDPVAFTPYADYLQNFCFLLAVSLEERAQRRRVESYATELERRVKERTTALNESMERFRALFAAIGDPVLVADAQTGLLVECNPAAEAYFGRSRHELIGLPQRELHPPDAPVAHGKTRDFLAQVEAPEADSETRLLAAGGEVRLNTVRASRFAIQGQELILGIFRDVTEQRRTEAALAASHARFLGVFTHSPAGLLLYDAQGVVLLANPSTARIFGVPDAKAYVGMNLLERVPEGGFRESLRKTIDGTPSGHLGWYESVLSGKRVYLSLQNVSIAPDLFMSVFEDRTEAYRSQVALADSALRFEDLANSGQALIWSSGEDKLCDYFNEPWLRFTGRTMEQELGNGWAEGVHPDDFQRCLDIYVTSFDRRESFSMEYRLRHASGEYRWIIDQGTPRFDSAGRFLGYIGHCLDIHDQKLVAQRLQESESRLFLALKLAKLGHWELDVAAGEFTFSDSLYALLRTSAEQMGGYRMGVEDYAKRFLPEDESSRVAEETRLALAADDPGYSRYVEHRVRFADGELGHMAVRIAILKDAEGRTVKTYGVNQDITERKRTEEALQESEQRYKLLHNASFGGIFLHDKGIILDCNQGLAEMTGYAYEELIGMDGMLLLHEDSRGLVMDTIRAASEKPYEAVGRRKNGEEYPVRLEARNIPYHGRTIRAVEFRDITELKRAEAELVAAKEGAEAANRAKSMFLANMSHEIRTPLNGLLGMLQLIKGSEVSGEVEMFADMAIRAGKRLTSLLGDILDLSRIEAGRMPISEKPFSLRNISEALTETFSPMNYSRKVVLRQVVAPDCPEWLAGDELRVRQVLFNLVGNAMKFTEKGEVLLSVSPLPARPSGAVRLLFVVSDHGLGIPDDKLDEICRPFTQVSQDLSKTHQGAGLGLAISHRLVKAMGGTLTFDSVPGVGTDVYLSLPFRLVAAAAESLLPRPAPGEPTPMRILLVEDEEISRLSAKLTLEKSGHDVVIATNGQEALEALRQEIFDCVFMDVQMEVMDGVEATRQIRAGKAGILNPHVPIVAMTAYAMLGDRERFLAAGMTDYLSKPVSREDLAQALERITR